MAPTETALRRADLRAAGSTAPASDVTTTRRAANRRRSARRRRMHRLRRTATLALGLLFVGTVVARGAQDPAVALPRGVQSASSSTALPGTLGSAADVARAGTAPAAATAVPSTAPSSAASEPAPSESMGEVEEGAPEPTAAPGAALAPVQASAKGTMHPIAIPDGPWASAGRAVRLSIEVEDGLSIDEALFAATVAGILSDPQGWQTADGVRFVPVSPAQIAAGAGVDVRVTLATPTLTGKLCGPLNVTAANVSCWWGGRAVLNLHRWVRGSATYGTDLTSYRTYLVNHEVGHGLGHRHVSCPAPGRPAPIMVQQTLGLEGCRAWPWPTQQ